MVLRSATFWPYELQGRVPFCYMNKPGELCPQGAHFSTTLGAGPALRLLQHVNYLWDLLNTQLSPRRTAGAPQISLSGVEQSIAILTLAHRAVTAQRINRKPRHEEWAGVQGATLNQYWIRRQAVHKPSRHAERRWCQQPWLSWVRLFRYPWRSDSLEGRTSNFFPFTNAMPGGVTLYSFSPCFFFKYKDEG